MNRKEIKRKYDSLVKDTERMRVYDGRGKGVDIYVCGKCGNRFHTRYKDKGVTPFTLRCRNKDCGGTMYHETTVPENAAVLLGVRIHNWVRPTLEQLLKEEDGTVEHVLNGGLLLEEDKQ